MGYLTKETVEIVSNEEFNLDAYISQKTYKVKHIHNLLKRQYLS